MDDDCTGWTLELSVEGADITLHGHSLLTPELAESYLTRMKRGAVSAARQMGHGRTDVDADQ